MGRTRSSLDALHRENEALTKANDSVAGMTDRQVVVKEHTASHTDPIAVRAGDAVTVGRRDTTWPEYVWCTGPDGREGWVPEAFLEPAGDDGAVEPGTAGGGTVEPGSGGGDATLRRVRRDYDARELDVAPGDVVLAGEEAGGWYWCEAADGRRGWVPAECLAMLERR
jgi:hypothetical protein